VGAKKKKTSVVLLAFNPLWLGFIKDFLFPNELGGFKIINLGLWVAAIDPSTMEDKVKNTIFFLSFDFGPPLLPPPPLGIMRTCTCSTERRKSKREGGPLTLYQLSAEMARQSGQK
jgi:hypothetical protein